MLNQEVVRNEFQELCVSFVQFIFEISNEASGRWRTATKNPNQKRASILSRLHVHISCLGVDYTNRTGLGLKMKIMHLFLLSFLRGMYSKPHKNMSL